MTKDSLNLNVLIREFKGLLKISNAFLIINALTLFIPLCYLKDAPTVQENIWGMYVPPILLLSVILLILVKLKKITLIKEYGYTENWINEDFIAKQVTILILSFVSPALSVLTWFNRETVWDLLVSSWSIIPIIIFANFWLVISMAIKNRIKINKEIIIHSKEELK